MRGDRIAIAMTMVARRPVRSLLAALGMGISVAAMLIAVALAEKGKTAALAEIRKIGANVLTVNAEPTRNRGTRARTNAVVTTLTLLDARAIEREVDGVSLTSAEYRATVPIKVGDLARQAPVSASEPAYRTLRESPMRAGRFFTEDDDAQASRVAVLGGRLANDLFEGRDPMGETIHVRGMPFTVIGVLAERGTGLDAFDEDEVVFIPLRTARLRLFPATYVHRIFVRVSERANLTEVAASIDAALRARHHTVDGTPPDFRVQDQRRLVNLRETTIHQLGEFQLEVSVALLGAGALGIFALQLLSVRERRAEIGTRRAIGATRGMVFQQFVLEAAIICLLGSLTGVGLAAGAAAVARVDLPAWFTAAAFGACCASGLLAAIWPARSAARMQPAVALRG